MSHNLVQVIYRKQLGDLVLLQPAIQLLGERHRAEVVVRTRPGFADVLALMPGKVRLVTQMERRIEQVYCFDTKASSLLDALICYPARRNLVMTRERDAWWHRLFFSRVWRATDRTEYRGRLFHSALGGEGFNAPRLLYPPIEWHPQAIPERYLVLHPTSAWQRKTWPVQSWIALFEKLLPLCPLPILVTSGSEAWEQEMAGAIAAAFPERLINLAGKTNLRAYISILSRADAVLTVDGSASHLGAAFGRRVLTLFGPTNPVHWHNPTQTSRALAATSFVSERRPPTAGIPVEAVFQVVSELIDGIQYA